MIDWRAAWAVAVKDMRAVRANMQVWLPMLIVPLVLGVVLPIGFVLVLLLTDAAGELADILSLLDNLPEGALGAAFATLATPALQATYFVANYLLAPFFLLIPLMAASTISSDSFAGEKERGTLEALLFSPIDLGTLFTGKVLAAFLPAVGLSLFTFLLTAISVNAVAWPWFGRVFFPTLNWLPLMLLVVPLLSLAMIFLTVYVSARVATFQAAYQLGGVAVLPVLALVVGQATGLLFLSTWLLFAIGVALAIPVWLLFRMLRQFMDRARLFESQVR